MYVFSYDQDNGDDDFLRDNDFHHAANHVLERDHPRGDGWNYLKIDGIKEKTERRRRKSKEGGKKITNYR